MKAIIFPQQNAIYGKDQPEYKAVPAYSGPLPGAPGKVCVICYELDENELKVLAATGKLWLTLVTYGGAMQPHRVDVDNPFEGYPTA